MNQVISKDAGLYTCVATNGEVKMEIPTFVVVQGTIPKFASNSYIELKTLFDAYMQFDIEILFKPEDPNGNNTFYCFHSLLLAIVKKKRHSNSHRC